MDQNWPHDIAADLPQKRDDEPQSLRDDIIAEIADHLACAAQREQFQVDASQQPDEVLWQRVLQRFGSPSQLARKLWWDSMWEKVMMQRFTIALMCLIVLGLGAMLYSMNVALNRSNQQQALLMKELLQVRDSKVEGATKIQPTEWNNLTVKLVYDDAAKTPVVGAKVNFKGFTQRTQAVPSSERITSSEGVVDFGLVLYGRYQLDAETNDHLYAALPSVSVHPGQDRLVEVIVPKKQKLPVDVEVSLPNQAIENLALSDRRLWYRVIVQLAGTVQVKQENSEQVEWKYLTQRRNGSIKVLYISPEGIVRQESLHAVKPEERFTDQFSDADQRIHRFALERWLIPDDLQPTDTVDLSIGQYNYDPDYVDLFVEMTLNDGRRILSRVVPPQIPSLFSHYEKSKLRNVENEFEKVSMMLKQNAMWAYANHQPISQATSRFGSIPATTMASSYGGEGYALMGSYGGGGFGTGTQISHSSLQYFAPKPQRNAQQVGFGMMADGMYGGEMGMEMMSGGGGYGAEAMPAFDVILQTTESDKQLTVQFTPDTSLLQIVSMLNKIPVNHYPVAGYIGVKNDVTNWKEGKFDIGVYSSEQNLHDTFEPAVENIAIVEATQRSVSLDYSQSATGYHYASCLFYLSEDQVKKAIEVIPKLIQKENNISFVAKPVADE